MRFASHIIVLTVSSLLLLGCTKPTKKEFQRSFEGKASLDTVGQCVGQNWDSAYPRLFPVELNEKREVFRAYNGLTASITDNGNSRLLAVKSPALLTDSAVRYFEKCVQPK